MGWLLYDRDLRHERVKKIKIMPEIRHLVVHETSLNDVKNLCFKIYFKPVIHNVEKGQTYLKNLVV